MPARVGWRDGWTWGAGSRTRGGLCHGHRETGGARDRFPWGNRRAFPGAPGTVTHERRVGPRRGLTPPYSARQWFRTGSGDEVVRPQRRRGACTRTGHSRAGMR